MIFFSCYNHISIYFFNDRYFKYFFMIPLSTISFQDQKTIATCEYYDDITQLIIGTEQNKQIKTTCSFIDKDNDNLSEKNQYQNVPCILYTPISFASTFQIFIDNYITIFDDQSKIALLCDLSDR
jgi:hypothetical protein